MVCETCNPEYNVEFPYSLAGRNIWGRSTAGYDVRIRSEPVYERMEQVPMNHEMAPPDVELMRYGRPLTVAERQQKHYAQFANSNLPPRGTGLQTWNAGQSATVVQKKLEVGWLTPLVVGGILGLIFGAFIFTGVGREIGYKAGKRVARRI